MERAVLRDGGVSVGVSPIGATVLDWHVPLNGQAVPVILSPGSLPAPAYMGATVGRVANRIGGAGYVHGGRRVALVANDGPNQLHGGPDGLSAVRWDMTAPDPRRMVLRHLSPDGAGGFPGQVAFEIRLSLDGARLTWDMRATVDCETPVSLAQHNYYNLAGAGSLAGQSLWLDADRVLDRDRAGIMTGAIHPVDGTRFDLRQPRPLPLSPDDAGVMDDFLLFTPGRDPALPVAQITAANGLRLRLWSDQPGAQVYTGQGLRPLPCAGVCIEPSGYPNAVNRPGFPSVICTPDRPWRQVLSVEIARIP